jgi:hypothetical protein
VPLSVRSPACIRRSPSGILLGGILQWVSEMQTTFMGVAGGGGRCGRPRRVSRMLCRQVRRTVRGLWSRVYTKEGGSKGELGGRRNAGRRPISGLTVGRLGARAGFASLSPAHSNGVDKRLGLEEEKQPCVSKNACSSSIKRT